MATITAQPASSNTAVTYTAASAGGDTIAAGTAQRVTVLVRNASAAAITATLTAVNACSQGFLHNIAITCAVGDTEVAVPSAAVTTSGTVGITYSASASVTVAAITT